jgi:hypothetical protein
LLGLVEGLNYDSDTSLVGRILCVVAIEIGDSLLLVLPRDPVLDEVLDLRNVHELDVINMAILLPLDDHIGRNAFVAHSFGVGLMVLAGFIHLITHP